MDGQKYQKTSRLSPVFRSCGRHIDGLKTIVVRERIGDPGKGSAISTDKAGHLPVGLVRGRCRIVNVVGAVNGGHNASR